MSAWLCAVCVTITTKGRAPLADTMIDGTMLCVKHARERVATPEQQASR
jgi:hypothetical protein